MLQTLRERCAPLCHSVKALVRRTPRTLRERCREDALCPAAWLTDAYLLLMGTLFLLYFNEKGLSAITSAKRDLYYWLTGVYAGLALPAILAPLCTRADARAALWRRLRATWPVYACLLAYLLFTLASALLSRHGTAVWLGASRNDGFVTHLAYVGSFTLVGLLVRPKRMHIAAFAVGLTLFGVVALLHVCGADPLRLYPQGTSFKSSRGRYVGTVGNVGFVSALFCVAIPMLTVCVLRGRGRRRLFLLLPLGLCVFLTLKLWVLAALVGLGAGTLLCLPFVLRFPKQTMLRYYAGLAGLALLLTALLWCFDVGKGFPHELHELLHLRWADSFGTGRFFIWRQVIPRLGEHWAFGTGPDTMALEGMIPFSRYDWSLGRTVYASIDAAHNEYLNILFHQGVFALLAYLGALFFALRGFVSKAKTNAWTAGCGAAVVCYGIEACFGISQPLTTPFFWLALALLCASFTPGVCPCRSSAAYSCTGTTQGQPDCEARSE